MKKFIAILLSALMLCAMIPFATVAAAEDVSVELIASVEEVNAGDTFEVEVYLNNLDTTAGLIGARVEIGFDSSAFELVTYFDEDEEMWFPPIEIGAKYNASSNKYIMYSPIDEETGAMERCLVKYMRATASATQVRKEDHFFTVTFKVKDDAPSGTYPLTVVDNEGVDLLAYGNVPVDYDTIETSIVVKGNEPACEHEYEYDCSKICALCGEETRPEAEHEYFNDCETVCMICYQETREASHNVVHVEAKDATCGENGNIEYWYCDVCGAAWLNAECNRNTNLRAVVLPATGEHVYDDEYDADCNVCGDVREVPEKPIEVAYGDLNGDGNINNRDLAMLQQYLNGWDVTPDEAAADVNGDGNINNRDLAMLQQYLNGWDVTLGAA